MTSDLFAKGLKIRTEVLGEAYVRKALAGMDDFNKPLQELVTEYCWGAVWGREGLERSQRSMINLAMISVLNRPHELKAHIRGALTNGLTRAQIARDIPAGRDLRRRAGGGRQLPHRARNLCRNRCGRMTKRGRARQRAFLLHRNRRRVTCLRKIGRRCL